MTKTNTLFMRTTARVFRMVAGHRPFGWRKLAAAALILAGVGVCALAQSQKFFEHNTHAGGYRTTLRRS